MSKLALIVGNLPVSEEKAKTLLKGTRGNLVPIWENDAKIASIDRSDVEVIVTAKHKVVEGFLKPWPNVKMLSLAFTGYDDVDFSSCRERRLYVYFVPDYSKASVAELVVLLTLAVLRKLLKADRNTRTGKFDRDGVQPGVELEGKTIGIIGTGKIGTYTAKKFLGLGCKVIGWNRSERAEFLELGPKFESLGSEYEGCVRFSTDLSKVLSQSDIVSLHLATNKDTHHFVDKAFLAKMQRGSVLINTARGRLIRTADLLEALKEGRLMGAGIDVYDHEPVPKEEECDSQATRELIKMPQVVLTPHLGFKTDDSLGRLVKETIANVGRYVRRVQGEKSDDVKKNCLLNGPEEPKY